MKRINPVKAKVDMLIKEKLDKKGKYGRDYRREKRNTLDTIEYYDYDEEQEAHDAMANERGVKERDAKLSTDDKAEIKRGKNAAFKIIHS